MKFSVISKIGVSSLLSVMLVAFSGVLTPGSVVAASVNRMGAATARATGVNPAALHPSASCQQPDRQQAVSTLTLSERLSQGYPLPVVGKTDPALDKIIHDKGKHFCADTDVQRRAQTTVNRSESNSRNWSGNYAVSENYTYVQAVWVESCIAFGTNDHVVTWVGIGGVGNNNLVQTGTEEDNWSLIDHESYTWVENTGTNFNVNLFSISCGDTILAEVGTGNCMIVVDESSGSSSGWRCDGPNANSGTAECIVEAPTVNGSVAELSNYGTEKLTSCDVEVNAGSNQGINSVPHNYYNMYDGGTLLSSTGSITNNNTYTMTWHAYS